MVLGGFRWFQAIHILVLTLLETVYGYRAFSHSVFEKLRFQLVFYPQGIEIYFENALSKLST